MAEHETYKLNLHKVPGWIRGYCTVVGLLPKHPENNDYSNRLEELIKICLPDSFESYAVILHPFLVHKSMTEEQAKNKLEFDEIPFDEFVPITWDKFCRRKNHFFRFGSHLFDTIDPLLELGQNKNELFPSEGVLDKAQLKMLQKGAKKYFGIHSIECYYMFMNLDHKTDLHLQGTIDELVELCVSENETSPALIYDVQQRWAISSDYDLPYSFIGGEREFIRDLSITNPNEIFIVKVQVPDVG